jgi:hypothetical protein
MEGADKIRFNQFDQRGGQILHPDRRAVLIT